jgi:hypothetical protein
MNATGDLADLIGPVAFREFENAPDWAKEKLRAWCERVPALSDNELLDEAASAILESAMVNSWRGNWDHLHCRATVVFRESGRRHRAAGHADNCAGDTLYSIAFARSWRSQGHPADAYPPKDCTCGRGTR